MSQNRGWNPFSRYRARFWDRLLEVWYSCPPMLTIGRMSETAPPADAPLFCARCAAELHPGRGDFYLVRIEAVADPTSPAFSAEDLIRDAKAEIADLLGQLKGFSERELLDQVYRRVVLHLCTPCYRQWIEHPAG
jgi:hypothetical protein